MGKYMKIYVKMISVSFQTSKDLFDEVRRWQDMQRRRRLFYFNHQEVGQLPGLLMLHKAYVLYRILPIISIVSFDI
jgi:hypothetical protein